MIIQHKHVETLEKLAKRHKVRNVKKMSCVSQKPYTTVAIEHGGQKYHGFSKCSPKDHWDPDIGFSIALSRAIKGIGV